MNHSLQNRTEILQDFRRSVAEWQQQTPLTMPVLAAFDREMRRLPSALEF